MSADDKLIGRKSRQKTLGSTVQEYRQKYGWTQDELAWRMEMTRVQIGRIERDECVPTVATVEKLEKALQLPRLTLLKAIDPSEPSVDVRKKVGQTFRDFEREVVRNMSESELETMCQTISAFTDLMRR